MSESGSPLPPAARPNSASTSNRRAIGLGAAVIGVLGVAAVGAFVTAEASSSAAVSEIVLEPAVVQAAVLPDLEGDLGQNALEPTTANDDLRADGGCTIEALSVRLGSDGDGVACLQTALTDEGFYDDTIDGAFDNSLAQAVMAYQEDQHLFVDGIVGRESAIELDIWPDEESLITRTPPPPAGATDSLGFALSVVATTGDDAPPLPDNSGSGRRVVYDRAGQRVWAVAEDGEIIRSWLVSGSKYSNEQPGTHTVYSRSDMSTAWNGQAWLPQMIRYQKTEIGNIGFHAIPLHVSDNSIYQTSDELGTRLSGGCQRQANEDAAFMWAFAPVGTTIVVT
ncbi:MAG: hypothetical protein DRJ50_00325 [Actinobacteria bacterium]|nr:MAG: hypothetical protein DRJ50_00325 [Actinomycetota bacterium]